MQLEQDLNWRGSTKGKEVRKYRVQSQQFLQSLQTEVTAYANKTTSIWHPPIQCKNSIKKPTEHYCIFILEHSPGDGFTPVHSIISSFRSSFRLVETPPQLRRPYVKSKIPGLVRFQKVHQGTNMLYGQNKVIIFRDPVHSFRCNITQTGTT